MGSSQKVGSNGENFAVAFLEFKGFELLHRNWRAGPLEIDIIAKDKSRLVFIEVKSRKYYSQNLHPEDMVNSLKQRRLIKAAQKFLMRFPHDGPVRFDVISIVSNSFSRHLYYHPDAFFPVGN